MTVSKGFMAVLGIITSILLARVFGAQTIGVLGYAMAYAGLFSIILNPGFEQYLVKTISQNNSIASSISNFIAIKVALILFFILIGAVYFTFFGQFDGNRTILGIFFLYVLLQSIYSGFVSIYTGLQNYVILSITQVVPKVIYIILFSIVCWLRLSIEIIAVVMVLELLFQILCAGFYIRRANFMLEKPSWAGVRKYIEYTKPIVLLTVFGMILVFLDKILIKKFIGEVMLGIFIIAQRLFSVPQFMLKPISTQLFPKICSDMQEDKGFVKNINRIKVYFAIVAGFLVIQMVVLSDSVVILFYGKNFSLAADVLKIYSFCIAARLLFRPYNTIIYAIEKQHTIVWFNCLVSTISIGLYLYMIPNEIYGIKCLGLGILAIPLTEAIVWFLSGAYYIYIVKKDFDGIEIIKPFIVVCLAFVCIWFSYYFGMFIGVENIHLRSICWLLLTNLLFITLNMKIGFMDKYFLDQLKSLFSLKTMTAYLHKNYKMASP